MTKSEAYRIVAMISGAWSRPTLADSAHEVYALALADLDYETAKEAVMRLVQTSKWLPTVAEIREAAVKERVLLPQPEEAWGIVRRAISSIGHYRSPAFDCDEIHDAVQAIGWREVCLGDNPSANRARFIDAFKSNCARRIEAEQRGRYLASERQLVGELVETGYATKRWPQLEGAKVVALVRKL